ncbi:hypothetical protein Y886_07135 [Xanthomonas hyacinthi DSM 19077]|nr:hypothetical protein Y886_07135 [Xanthomonas hyacinthi DSM 19077]
MYRALALLLLLLLIAVPAAAQTTIHRCIGTDGRPVFSDQQCTSIGATSIMPPAPAAASSTAVDTPTGPNTGLLCAKDVAGLREGIAQAFANRDANRIGGLILWSGYGSGGAIENIRNMNELVHQSLLAGEGNEAGGLDAVTARPGNDAATRRAHFSVGRDSGCLWLRPPA